MIRSLVRSRTRTNPVFWADELRLAVGAERFERALHEPDSVDLLAWNVFESLERHSDRDWLAHRLQLLGGSGVRAPARLALWTGRDREPVLQPSRAYVEHVRERARLAGADGDLKAFAAPLEVPLRIESPDVLVLVDLTIGPYPRGAGGRDRLLELIDAGLPHAERLSKALAVGVVYPSGTSAASELSARVNRLRDPRSLAAELSHLDRPPSVLLREISWQQLLRVWESEVDYLPLGGQPVKAFLDHVRRLGLR